MKKKFLYIKNEILTNHYYSYNINIGIVLNLINLKYSHFIFDVLDKKKKKYNIKKHV